VEETLREVADQFRAPAQEAQLTFVIEVSPNLPRLLVDGELIARVIYNLVDNAIKFSPEHGIVRLIACHAPEPGYLELSVVDQGKGISPDILPLLFNKFQRDRQITSRRNGTGLGLFFCRLAVEAHGGKIWVESQLEKGSTFKIILPAEQKGH
jgi:signal transduction histidine kinase